MFEVCVVDDVRIGYNQRYYRPMNRGAINTLLQYTSAVAAVRPIRAAAAVCADPTNPHK